MQRLLSTILLIAGAWGAASVGYFNLLPLLDAKVGYNDEPVFFTLYYAGWAGIVFLVFRRSFESWASLYPRPEHLGYAAVMAVVFAGFAMLVLPRLPETEWTFSEAPVEFFWANSWYFLPKSLEILFQQLLIAALILALHALHLQFWRISLLVAVLFGGFHLSMALSYPNPVYVLRYSIAATIFGAMVPYFILRMRYGFFVSYAVHWGYYALDIALIHFVFAAK